MLKNILSKRELLPTPVMYIPIFIYGVFLGIKYNNLTFFTNLNTLLVGCLEIDKYTFIQKTSSQFNPITIIVRRSSILDVDINKTAIKFPCIVKPNHGCRGMGVKKIHSVDELDIYHKNSSNDYLIQEFINYPIELGVYYIRKPSQSNGEIVGVVYKKFPFVVGNGILTLKELIEKDERTKLFVDNFFERNSKRWNEIIPLNEKVDITDLGNHAQGAQCIDVSYLVSKKVIELFDEISKSTGGIYFGRYDIKCSSFEKFSAGENIKIIEFNGVIAEPLHLYDPKHGPWKAYKHWFNYIKKGMEISLENKHLGYSPSSLIDAYKLLMNQWKFIR